jgi:hypothetical protein
MSHIAKAQQFRNSPARHGRGLVVVLRALFPTYYCTVIDGEERTLRRESHVPFSSDVPGLPPKLLIGLELALLPKLLLREWPWGKMGVALPVGEGVGDGRAVRRKKLMGKEQRVFKSCGKSNCCFTGNTMWFFSGGGGGSSKQQQQQQQQAAAAAENVEGSSDG